MLLLTAIAAAPASAEESPPGCTTSGLHLSLGSPITVLRNGDAISFTASVSNNATGACDVTDTTIKLQLPSADGTPTGQVITLASHQDYLGGSGSTALPSTPYTVNLNQNVLKSPVKLSFEGTGHFPGGNTPDSGSLETNVFVIHPHVTLTVTPSPESGPTPLPVTYTYSAQNDSTFDTNNPSPALQSNMRGPSFEGPPVLTDDTCSPVVFTGGDTNTNETLDQGETWTYSCTHLFGIAGMFVDHVTLAGTNSRDGREWPTTTQTSSVDVSGPTVAAVPNPKDFGNVVVGTSSAAQTFVVSNSSAVPLVFGSNAVSVVGTDAASFPASGDGCSGQTIAQGANCSVAVSFAPSGVGAKSAALRLADNAADTPQSISLAGRGTVIQTLPVVHGSKRTKHLRPVFTFSSEPRGATFSCKVGKLEPQACSSPYRLPNIGRGKHRFEVQATSPSGDTTSWVGRSYRVLRPRKKRK